MNLPFKKYRSLIKIHHDIKIVSAFYAQLKHNPKKLTPVH